MTAPKRPWVGRATIALGIVHMLATLPPVWEALPRIAERGWWGGISGTLPPPPEAMASLAALFSLVVGVLLLVAGGLLVRLERAGLALPGWLGPTFLATGVLGAVLLPASGFWLVGLLGLWLTARPLVRRHG